MAEGPFSQASRDYERIEKAIRYLENHFREQPSLAELARHVHMSEFHFQRLFRRWVGISPKRFLQCLTRDFALELLQRSRNVLEVSFAAGLSGPGRLHDLLVTCDAVTPGEAKRRGAGLKIRYAELPTPFGPALIARTERGICWLAFTTGEVREDPLQAMMRHWRNAEFEEDAAATAPLVERIFHPDRVRTSPVEVHLRGTNFQIKVWRALLQIPPGTLVAYSDLARALGMPHASRAVGTAVGRNPISYLIPCHRVLRSSGMLAGYRWGLARKRAMIAWEAAGHLPED